MPELVAIAEQLLAPVSGGTGRYTRELLRAMAAQTPEGWRLSTATSRSGRRGAAEVDGVSGPRRLPLGRRALTAAWDRGFPLWPGGDAVHAMTPLAPPPRRHRGLVVTVHDTVPWTHPDTLTPRGASWHRRVIARAARGADALVVPTRAVATDLVRHVDVTAPIHVVGEGVSTNLEHPGGASAAIAGIPLERLPPRYVLAIGTVEPRKGFDHLVRALAEPHASEVPLLIAGQRGWGELDLDLLARQLRLPAERVRVLGAVTDAELGVLLRGATALAVPSLAEGFGLPLLEAMSAGVPVVHTDVPALAEVAGGAGVAVPRADPTALASALRAVVEDPARRAALREAGSRRAEEFSWQRAARAVWRVHLDVTEK